MARDTIGVRCQHMEEAVAALTKHASTKPAEQYQVERWHAELLRLARRYARTVNNLTRGAK